MQKNIGILSIGGSDPSSGAGIQADLRIANILHVYCANVITRMVSQNTNIVNSIFDLPGNIVERQIDAVFEDFEFGAIKIGLIGNREIAKIVHNKICDLKIPIIVDPIVVSTTGMKLVDDSSMEFLKEKFFNIATLITPNLHELFYISGFNDITKSAEFIITKFGCRNVLVTGRVDGDKISDILYCKAGNVSNFDGELISDGTALPKVRGTGCSFSTAIACYIASGLSLNEAIRNSKNLIRDLIIGSKKLGKGEAKIIVA